MIRSVLAVLAGGVVLTVASFGIESVIGPVVGTPMRLFTMAYTLACVVAGGLVTAWLAPSAPVKHAIVLGVIQVLMTIGVWVSGTAPGNSPAWQWIVGIALLVPSAWWGGALAMRVRTQA